MKIKYKLCALLLSVLLLTGCADYVSYEDASTLDPVGFWYGLWHGFSISFAFLVSLFNDDVAIYAIYNNGGWYDWGFVMGVGLFFRLSSP